MKAPPTVDDAVTYSELEVALVVVELRAVKLPKVLDALVRIPPVSVESPVTPRVLESVALERVERPLAVSVLKVAPLVALN